MPEYWWSARKACINALNDSSASQELPSQVPYMFKFLRPWVHHGWEMVLIAAELINNKSLIEEKSSLTFTNNYVLNCQKALQKHGWSAEQLQQTLDEVRNEAIKDELGNWIKLHRPFLDVIAVINMLQSQKNIDIAILTTKGERFTKEILNSFACKPNQIYGHECGPKCNILLELMNKHKIIGFIEDRRATLEIVVKHSELKSIPCFLADWGYLKPNDCQHLPKEIRLLSRKAINDPLARWL